MQINIECEYCGSVYNYSENHSCPNCAAVPGKDQITAARAAAKAEALGDPKPDSPASTGKLMRVLIKLIPVWIIIFFAALFIPDIKERSVERNAKSHLQTVDSPEFREHGLNEKFLFDGLINITVDDVYFAESPTAEALLPDGMKLLVIHISAEIAPGADQRDIGNYYDSDSYIEFGNGFQRPMTYSALRVFPETFSQQMFNFFSMKYYDSRDGNFCFLVDKDTEEFTFCIDETHTEGYVRQLDCIHRIKFSITEEAE